MNCRCHLIPVRPVYGIVVACLVHSHCVVLLSLLLLYCVLLALLPSMEGTKIGVGVGSGESAVHGRWYLLLARKERKTQSYKNQNKEKC